MKSERKSVLLHLYLLQGEPLLVRQLALEEEKFSEQDDETSCGDEEETCPEEKEITLYCREEKHLTIRRRISFLKEGQNLYCRWRNPVLLRQDPCTAGGGTLYC